MAKQGKIYIIGHKNPDTDSICSAIAYADIKNRLNNGYRYSAKRAGQINEETAVSYTHLDVYKRQGRSSEFGRFCGSYQ